METHSNDSLVFAYNKKAMDYLRSSNFKAAQAYLSKAEDLLSTGSFTNLNKLLGITLNNFSCLYKRTGNPTLALNFLQKALQIGSQPPIDHANLAGTHLNMCAILSTIGNHQKGLKHALKALSLLKTHQNPDRNTITTLIAAHHNAGVEYESLFQVAEAKKIYLQGLNLTIQTFGEDHPLALSLKKSLKSVSGSRKNLSFSPMRSSAAEVRSSRASAPRGHRTSIRVSDDFNKVGVKDSLRFVTGERLQPMFKKEDFRTRELKIRRKAQISKEVIKAQDKEVKIQKEEDKGGEETRDTAGRTDASEGGDKKGVCVATQVEFWDRRGFKVMRNNAAIVVQKHWRGFLAKKRVENEKYERQVKEAEEQIRRAKEKLENLRMKKMEKVKVERSENEMQKEIVPVAYKDKLERRSSRIGTLTNKRRSVLAPIPEENEYLNAKAVKIQKNFRRWRERKGFKDKKKAAVMIQRAVRRHQVRTLYLVIRDAILCIQKFWRTVKEKQRFRPVERKINFSP